MIAAEIQEIKKCFITFQKLTTPGLTVETAVSKKAEKGELELSKKPALDKSKGKGEADKSKGKPDAEKSKIKIETEKDKLKTEPQARKSSQKFTFPPPLPLHTNFHTNYYRYPLPSPEERG